MTEAEHLSLLKLFEPDDDYIGEYGMLCGYSADADFMREAAIRFSHDTINDLYGEKNGSSGKCVRAIFVH